MQDRFYLGYGQNVFQDVLIAYGAPIKIWSAFLLENGLPTSGFLYSFLPAFRQIPLKAKFCPFKPEAINAKRIDEGPTKGMISIRF